MMADKKCPFFSKYRYRDRDPQKGPTRRLRTEYVERILDTGVPGPVASGTMDIALFVDAGRQTTLISNIVNRYKMGDTEVLNRKTGSYLDVSRLPDNLVDAFNFGRSTEERFYQLDPELRSMFRNSPVNFAMACENGSFDKIFSQYVKQKSTPAPAAETKGDAE